MWLRRVVLRGLAITPASRYPSIDALLEALDRGSSGDTAAVDRGHVAAGCPDAGRFGSPRQYAAPARCVLACVPFARERLGRRRAARGARRVPRQRNDRRCRHVRSHRHRARRVRERVERDVHRRVRGHPRAQRAARGRVPASYRLPRAQAGRAARADVALPARRRAARRDVHQGGVRTAGALLLRRRQGTARERRSTRRIPTSARESRRLAPTWRKPMPSTWATRTGRPRLSRNTPCHWHAPRRHRHRSRGPLGPRTRADATHQRSGRTSVTGKRGLGGPRLRKARAGRASLGNRGVHHGGRLPARRRSPDWLERAKGALRRMGGDDENSRRTYRRARPRCS